MDQRHVFADCCQWSNHSNRLSSSIEIDDESFVLSPRQSASQHFGVLQLHFLAAHFSTSDLSGWPNQLIMAMGPVCIYIYQEPQHAAMQIMGAQTAGSTSRLSCRQGRLCRERGRVPSGSHQDCSPAISRDRLHSSLVHLRTKSPYQHPAPT